MTWYKMICTVWFRYNMVQACYYLTFYHYDSVLIWIPKARNIRPAWNFSMDFLCTDRTHKSHQSPISFTNRCSTSTGLLTDTSEGEIWRNKKQFHLWLAMIYLPKKTCKHRVTVSENVVYPILKAWIIRIRMLDHWMVGEVFLLKVVLCHLFVSVQDLGHYEYHARNPPLAIRFSPYHLRGWPWNSQPTILLCFVFSLVWVEICLVICRWWWPTIRCEDFWLVVT